MFMYFEVHISCFFSCCRAGRWLWSTRNKREDAHPVKPGAVTLCGDAWLSGLVVPRLAVPCCPQAGFPGQAKSAPCSPASPSTAKGLLATANTSLTKAKLRQVPQCRASPKLQSWLKSTNKAIQEGEVLGTALLCQRTGGMAGVKGMSPQAAGFCFEDKPSSEHPRWMKGKLWECCHQLEAAKSIRCSPAPPLHSSEVLDKTGGKNPTPKTPHRLHACDVQTLPEPWTSPQPRLCWFQLYEGHGSGWECWDLN